MSSSPRFSWLTAVFLVIAMSACERTPCTSGQCPEPQAPLNLRFLDIPRSSAGQFVLISTRLPDPVPITSSEMTISLPLGSNILAVQNAQTSTILSVSYANAVAGASQVIDVGAADTLSYLVFRSIGFLPFESGSFAAISQWIANDPQKTALAGAVAEASRAGGLNAVLARSDIKTQLSSFAREAAGSFACSPAQGQTGTSRLRPELVIGTPVPSCSDSTREINFNNGYERYIDVHLQQSNGVAIVLNGSKAFSGFLVDPVVGIPTGVDDVLGDLSSYVQAASALICGDKAVDVLTGLAGKQSKATFTLPAGQQTVHLVLSDDVYSLTATAIFLVARAMPIKGDAWELVHAVYDLYSDEWPILAATQAFIANPSFQNFQAILQEAIPLVWQVARTRGWLGDTANSVLLALEEELAGVRIGQSVLVGFSDWLEKRPAETIQLNVGPAYLPDCCGRQNQPCCLTTAACAAGLSCQSNVCVASVVSPVVSVSPGSGPKGTIFQEPGTGFTPNGGVTLYFQKPSGLGSTGAATADSSGSYSHVYDSSLVDETGIFSYWAVDNATGKRSPTAMFQISALLNPSVSVSPGIGPKGTIFQEPGTGFTPNRSVTLYFQKPSGLGSTGTAVADSSGAYSHVYDSSLVDETGIFSYWAVDNATGKRSPTATFQITM